ncbi:hypothetical protein [Haloferax denitrificans]|uniref:hypothetical protein n=1 Tax=Haloferax denitrificans TaxID=35745 RepID=UPI003C7014CB
MSSVTGLASAKGSNKKTNIDIKVDSVVEDGTKYSVALARDPKTGEVDGAILPMPVQDKGDGYEFQQVEAENSDLYGISDDVLAEVRKLVFEDEEKKRSPTNKNGATSTASEQETDIWGPLRNAAKSASDQSTNVSLQAESLLEDVVKEIAAGTKDSIDRLGVYYIDSPKGADCDASANSQPHHQFGASIEYEKKLGEFSEVIIGATIGAITTAVLSGGPAAPLGGIVGAVAGFAIKHLKDTTYITQVFRDVDMCSFGACAPSIRVFVSGLWMDEDKDLLTVNKVPDAPALHLENISMVNSGYREVMRISS